MLCAGIEARGFIFGPPITLAIGAKFVPLRKPKIDVCVNDCVLYRNEYADLEQCPICMESRWKSIHNNVVNKSDETTIQKEKKNKKVPNKILRYFPLTPRLQRLFMTKHVASDMRWQRRVA